MRAHTHICKLVAPTERLVDRCRRGFTLLELIVVITIIAIMAGVFLPRMTGQTQRAAEAEAVAVQRLLSAAAERASLVGGQRLALEFSVTDNVARLALMEQANSADGSGNAPAANSRPETDWSQSLLVEPVALEYLQLDQAVLDGRRLDPRRWLAPLGGSQIRPSITLVLGPREKSTPTAYRLDLPTDAIAATRTAISADALAGAGTRAVPGAAQTRAVDLDATGRGDSPW